MSKLSSPLLGLLAAKGRLSVETQKIVRLLCHDGRVLEVINTLAEHFVDQGMVNGRLPVNAGELTDELRELFTAAAAGIVKEYKDGGGYVLARGFAAELALVNAMLASWEKTFRAPIPVTRRLEAKMTLDELNDRACVAALAVRERLVELQRRGFIYPREHNGEVGIFIPTADLSFVIPDIVKATLKAFDDPNAAQSELLHPELHPSTKTS
jgi:hypothetical protein